MAEPIRPVTVEPTGDDQPWKRDHDRLTRELIARLEAAESRIEYLQGRVN